MDQQINAQAACEKASVGAHGESAKGWARSGESRTSPKTKVTEMRTPETWQPQNGRLNAMKGHSNWPLLAFLAVVAIPVAAGIFMAGGMKPRNSIPCRRTSARWSARRCSKPRDEPLIACNRCAPVRKAGATASDRCTEYGPVQPEALAFCTLKKEVGWNCDGPVQRMATRERELYDALKMVGCENGFRSMGYDTAHVACRFGLREGDRDLRQRSDVKFSPWNYYQCPRNWSGKCTTVQGKKHNYIRPGS